MQKYFVALISIAVLATLVSLAVRAWRRRAAQHEVQLGEVARNLSGLEIFSTDGSYVATTFANDPLNRVMAHGLGARGSANLVVTTDGLLLERAGEQNLAIPKTSILSVGLLHGTIDRVVEPDGLVAITWNLGGTELQTSLRIVDAGIRKNFIGHLTELTGKELTR
jgi:hypothetical protein